MNNKLLNVLMIVCLAFAWVACDDEDTPQPITINFTNQEVGLSVAATSAEVVLQFSRPVSSGGELLLTLDAGALVYGDAADFYTVPAASDNTLLLTYEAGDESVAFTVNSGAGLNIQQDQNITISLAANDQFVLGQNTAVSVSFSENFISRGATIDVDGGGPDQPFQAFIDLSKQAQNSEDKYAWDLGFSSEPNRFAVTLNSSAFVMARSIESTDIDAITPNDTLGFASKMYISNYNDPEAAGWIDNQNGSFDQTAIAAISETDSENKVYIIKRDGDNRNWKKIRVLRQGEDYLLQYADIASSTHQEITISKDDAYNFSHMDLDNGLVQIEPEKDLWDIMYSTYSGVANFGVNLAIAYNDAVVLNRSNVKAVKIEESEDVTYDNFTSADVKNYNLESDNIFVIGSSWRELQNFTLVLKPNVFYLVEDAQGNVYKLKFTSLTSDEAVRGYPQFKYELL